MKSRRITEGILILVAAAGASAQIEPDAGSWPTWVISNPGTAFELAPPPGNVEIPLRIPTVRRPPCRRHIRREPLTRFFTESAVLG